MANHTFTANQRNVLRNKPIYSVVTATSAGITRLTLKTIPSPPLSSTTSFARL
eukprot:m.445549 g.445549  ORF g.445549 m.445549 type:complete len:53 (+) comp19240_c0_seq1:519-677(+)